MIARKSTSVSDIGKWGILISLILIFSITAEYRVTVLGLLVHPYLLLLPLAVIMTGVNLFFAIPQKVLSPLVVFTLIFFVASLQNANPFSEPFKVAASLLTFLFFSASVRTERDFYLIAWGFVICGAVIGVRSFIISETEDVSRLSGINALEGIGNKNAQSLFTLPGLFLGTIVSMRLIAMRKWFFLTILACCLFFILISLFLSANRSGWVGLAVIFLSIFYVSGLRIRSLLLMTIIIAASYFVIENFTKDIFEHKRKQTVDGYISDEGRKLLMIHSLTVGLENPILGVGMDELHQQMAMRLKLGRIGKEKLDTHFLPGYLFGSSGIFAVIAFFVFLWTITQKIHRSHFPECSRARRIVIAFVALFIIRSLFTREILYSPTFMGALGLVYGNYLMHVRNAFRIRRV
jgi:hypothetical protein